MLFSRLCCFFCPRPPANLPVFAQKPAPSSFAKSTLGSDSPTNVIPPPERNHWQIKQNNGHSVELLDNSELDASTRSASSLDYLLLPFATPSHLPTSFVLPLMINHPPPQVHVSSYSKHNSHHPYGGILGKELEMVSSPRNKKQKGKQDYSWLECITM